MPNPYAPNLPLTSSQEWHLARRVAFAPTPALVAQIRSLGISAWLDRQISWSTIPDPVVDGLIKDYFPTTEMTIPQYSVATNQEPWTTSAFLRRSLHMRHRFSERYLHDAMVEFFSDLIYISASGKSDSLVCDFNRAVLRPHALGKFSDMLYAALTHPALIVYLDNQGSTKTDPNENLGRELLELHTVGVGNYTEEDVRNSSLLLTGHSWNWNTKSYVYNSWAHYVGPLKIMDFSHANSSAAYGPAVLKAYAQYLATHPATARRIATRLYVRFVEDIPPTGASIETSAFITKLAQAYLNNGTSIAPVVKKLLTSKLFRNSVGKKWRRPQESFATMVKILGTNTYVPSKPPKENPYDQGAFGWRLEKAGHNVRDWPAVNGYPDSGEVWLGANVMRESANMAESQVWRWDHEIVYSSDLKTTFKVKDGDNAVATAKRLTTDITGFMWNTNGINVIASFLSSTGMQPVTSTSVVSNVDRNLAFAIRQILSSPYFMVR